MRQVLMVMAPRGLWMLRLMLMTALLGGGLVLAAPVAAQDDDDQAESVTITLEEANDSGMSGTAVLTADNGTTTVVLTGEGEGGPFPVHIHEGTCDDPNPEVAFPLADLVIGESTMTVVGISLDELLASPYLINAHVSLEQVESLFDPTQYIACGNIVAAAPAADAPAADAPAEPTPAPPANGVGAGTGTMAEAGVGSAARAAASQGIAIAVAVMAAALVGGLVLRRRAAE